MGGVATDLTPMQSTVIGGQSYVNFVAAGHRFHFQAGVVYGQGIPVDFAHFECAPSAIERTTARLPKWSLTCHSR